MTLGGNNPPPDMFWGMHIDDLFSMLSDTLAGGAVDDDAKEAAIDGMLDEFRKASKGADKARADEKKPFDDAGKAVQAKYKPIVDKADRGAQACKDALTPYLDAKKRAKDEAARIAREEAAATQAAAQAALRASDDLEARFAAEAQLEQAAKLTAQANKIDRAPTGLRTTYTARVFDLRELAKHVMHHDAPAFEAFLIEYARKAVVSGVRSLPGVDISPERKAA